MRKLLVYQRHIVCKSMHQIEPFGGQNWKNSLPWEGGQPPSHTLSPLSRYAPSGLVASLPRKVAIFLGIFLFEMLGGLCRGTRINLLNIFSFIIHKVSSAQLSTQLELYPAGKITTYAKPEAKWVRVVCACRPTRCGACQAELAASGTSSLQRKAAQLTPLYTEKLWSSYDANNFNVSTVLMPISSMEVWGSSSIFLTFNTKIRSIDDKPSLEKHALL